MDRVGFKFQHRPAKHEYQPAEKVNFSKERCMKRSIRIALGLYLGCLSMTASALTVTLDSFSVSKNGNGSFFVDDFSDGNPPPDSPVIFGSGPAIYSYVTGSLIETGGKLLIDNTGAPGMNALGVPRHTARATLQTNTSTAPSAANNGIKSGHTFSVSGLFDFASDMVAGDNYGVRFVDRDASGSNDTANDFVQLAIQQTGSGTFIRFYEQDYVAQSIITLAQINLASIMPSGADQIALTLSRDDLDNNGILASFDFFADGLLIGSGDFAQTASIFDGENFTRAEFFVGSAVAAAVPEPQSFLLMLAGLGILGFSCRRNQA